MERGCEPGAFDTARMRTLQGRKRKGRGSDDDDADWQAEEGEEGEEEDDMDAAEEAAVRTDFMLP